MKKIIFAIAIMMTLGMNANAQRDTFFSDWYDANSNIRTNDPTTPNLPTSNLILGGECGNDENAPIGSGILILTALGAGYAVARKRREK
ncbi:MAG: hypothetical protein ACI358_07065 [Candidatus Limimorpha sp.]